MNMRAIGALQVSVIGLGCNNFGGRMTLDETATVIDAAIDAGINFFDTADVYGGMKSEEFIGQLIGARREKVIIASKFGLPIAGQSAGASPAYIRSAVEASLKRLNTDRIDLYQLHQPDSAVPIAETLGALNNLVQAGKVREIGCSNFSVAQLREAESASHACGFVRFVSVQNDYSLLQREPEAGVLAECERLQIGFLPYFPLANGLLTGKYRKGQPLPEGTRLSKGIRAEETLTPRNLDVVEALIGFAQSRGHTLLELAFSWLLARPAVSSVIAGATKPAQIYANAAAANWTLTPDDLARVDTLLVQPA